MLERRVDYICPFNGELVERSFLGAAVVTGCIAATGMEIRFVCPSCGREHFFDGVGVGEYELASS